MRDLGEVPVGDIWWRLRDGHWPTLIGAWLHLTVSFMVWLLMGALSLPIARALALTPAELSWLIALPLLGGTGLRLLGGWSCDWFGAKRTAIAILLGEMAVLLWGWSVAPTMPVLWGIAIVLGIGGASFAVALPLAGQAYPPASQGLVLGLAASGNIGTVLILFFAPRWAEWLGWQHVFGVMAGVVAATTVLFVWLVRDGCESHHRPRDVEWWHHAAELLRQRTAYWLCFLYAITFGGFIGLCSVLPVLLYDTYQLEAVTAGSVAALCGLLGSVVRPLGGYAADRRGGVQVLYVVLPIISGSIVAVISPSLPIAIAMMVVACGAMGFGNGVVFQLAAEGFPKQIGLVSGLIGAMGSIGGFLFPLAVSGLNVLTGSYATGLWFFAGLAVCAWGTVLFRLQRGASL